MIHKAVTKVQVPFDSCDFVFGNAESPPFDAATFDAVSSQHLLFNLPRPGVALRNGFAYLKPGGRMILIGDEPEGSPANQVGGRVHWMTAGVETLAPQTSRTVGIRSPAT